MEKFFTQRTCDRCGGALNGVSIMGMFNIGCICLKCKGIGGK